TLALECGEAEGICGLSWSTIKASRPHWITDKLLNVIVQMGLTKLSDLPDVPSALDLVADVEDKQVLELILIRQGAGRPFAAPPGVPADRLAALRRAFDATLADGGISRRREQGAVGDRAAHGGRDRDASGQGLRRAEGDRAKGRRVDRAAGTRAVTAVIFHHRIGKRAQALCYIEDLRLGHHAFEPPFRSQASRRAGVSGGAANFRCERRAISGKTGSHALPGRRTV